MQMKMKTSRQVKMVPAGTTAKVARQLQGHLLLGSTWAGGASGAMLLQVSCCCCCQCLSLC
jgi:hypothetical protein